MTNNEEYAKATAKAVATKLKNMIIEGWDKINEAGAESDKGVASVTFKINIVTAALNTPHTMDITVPRKPWKTHEEVAPEDVDMAMTVGEEEDVDDGEVP